MSLRPPTTPTLPAPLVTDDDLRTFAEHLSEMSSLAAMAVRLRTRELRDRMFAEAVDGTFMALANIGQPSRTESGPAAAMRRPRDAQDNHDAEGLGGSDSFPLPDAR